MNVFVHNDKNGKAEALGDFHDDGVIAYAISSKVIQEHPYRPKTAKVNRRFTETVTPTKKFRFGTK